MRIFIICNFYQNNYHDSFEGCEEEQEAYLETCECIFRADMSGYFEETLSAYTFLYEYIFHDDEGELIPLHIYYLKYIDLLNPNKELYRRRYKFAIPFTATTWDTNKIHLNRFLFNLLEDPFLLPEEDTFDSKYFWSDVRENSKYFKHFFLRKRKSKRLLAPIYKKESLPTEEGEDFFVDLTIDFESPAYLLERMQNLGKFKLKAFKILNLLQMKKENSKNRVKYFSIHKQKVSTKFSPRELRELSHLKELRQQKLRRYRKDPDLLADLVTDNDLPFHLGFFDDDHYETEFFNPHSRD